MLTILPGDCREVLKTLPDESVHCCVCSPPYWGLRDYGVAGQLGLEATPEEYVAEMVGIFREVRRVLRGDGTLWLNLGDSYAGSNGNGGKPGDKQYTNVGSRRQVPEWANVNLKPKDLIGIPWLVAFALRADGWYLRSEIIWAKPNPMPESVTDRPTKSHEQIFLLTKSARYFYDAEAIREPLADSTLADGRNATGRHTQGANGSKYKGNSDENPHAKPDEPSWYRAKTFVNPDTGRNKRSVWTIATSPYSDAHFATFPPKLVEPCILAGTSARGCCAECGAPWERVVERDGQFQRRWSTNNAAGSPYETQGSMQNTYKTTGWQPTCKHDADTVPATVLDPFAGSGTVGKVALELGRKAILIELNPKYCEMIDRRAEVTLGLPGLA